MIVSGGRRAIRLLQRGLYSPPGGLTVFAWHLIGAGTGTAVDLDRERFASQLDEIAALGGACTLSEAVAWMRGEITDDRPRILVTFDDAYANFADVAWPMLRERGMPAVLYVPVRFVDGRQDAPMRGAEDLRPCSWSTLRDLVADGLTVGSHTLTHPDLPRLSTPRIEDELRGARAEIEDRLGVPADSFCHPRGLRTRRTEALVARHYTSAAIGGGRRLQRGDSPLKISRVPIRREDRSILPMLSSRVWLEELCADTLRQARNR